MGLDFTEPLTVKGIDLDRFVAPDIMFGNVSVNPYNAGFCTPAGNCLPSGLLNVSVCRSGAPVIMSMPHFLGCDQDTIDTIVGLQPNREDHQSYIDIEPVSTVMCNSTLVFRVEISNRPAVVLFITTGHRLQYSIMMFLLQLAPTLTCQG